ncbi:glycosyltransferase family 4 protein [Luteolibacter sp. AS25]|uniref:glycosyltransferase family 4 protein n=1 Tax=Luteolibacter sp. AS25 TaxID=3135776 RepID=UPI00398AB6D0
MMRYAQLLNSEQRPEDPYTCGLIIDPKICRTTYRIKKYSSRKIFYPWLVANKCKHKITHILDHSWADMINYIPGGSMTVVTVHDLIPLRYPEDLTSNQLQRFNKVVQNLSKADALIAVSEYTKSEIINLLGIPADRIHVVPNGTYTPTVANITHATVRTKLPAGHGKLLIGSVGSILKRKNLDILPIALGLAKRKYGIDLALVRAGQILPSEISNRMRQQIGDDNLIELGHLSDDDLQAFYHQIDLTLVPSLYEGFGLPVIESMAHGKPVIAANSSCLPEVAGESAIYFDPYDPQDLALAISKLHSCEKLRTDLTKSGLRLAEKFTWRKSLEGVHNIYTSLLNNR